MKKLKIALGVTASLVAAFLGFVAMQPSEYRIARSARMAAPPAAVFGRVDVLKRWKDWSPWAKRDPAARESYEGPEGGKGAVFRWAGNAEVGEGSLTILESVPASRIRLRLDFVKPFEDTALVDFDFRDVGGATEVVWGMSGRNGFLSKLFCLFVDMDAMVGGDYEKGLAALKALVEGKPAGN